MVVSCSEILDFQISAQPSATNTENTVHPKDRISREEVPRVFGTPLPITPLLGGIEFSTKRL
jgi:hypothetical protein